MNNEEKIAIQVKNLTKKFKLYDNPIDRLKESLNVFGKSYHKDFYALNNISFEILQGKTVGIVGKNGSGKSTLLKIITGVLKETSGSVLVDGKISALLELGAGFNPELTGMQNIYLNGIIMGLKKNEIDRSLNSILEFAEDGDFIYQPVKSYSSGMFVRLAFSVAISVEPDILIVDEALAVGDMHFQLKCINKIKDLRDKGKTILFVTHDIYTVKNICNYAIWLKSGSIELQGEVNYVVQEYEKYIKNLNVNISNSQKKLIQNCTQKKYILEILEVEFSDSIGTKKNNFGTGENVIISIKYEIYTTNTNIVGGVALFDTLNQYICGLNTKLDNININGQKGIHILQLVYINLNLLPGSYSIDVGFFEDHAVARLDYKAKIASFTVSSDKYLAEGSVLLEHEWRCEEPYEK